MGERGHGQEKKLGERRKSGPQIIITGNGFSLSIS